MSYSPPPGAVYAIADVEALGGENLPQAVAAMAGEGIRWIQIRAKRSAGAELCRLVEASCDALAGSGCQLWLDDRADIGALFPLAGVHVGQHDLPPAAVRAVLGPAVAVGQSTHDRDQVLAADRDDTVDVIAVGPIFATTGKADPELPVGLDLLRWARRRSRKPLVAIGGIDAGNIGAVLAAGADAAAVLGAVCRGDVRGNCRRLQAAAGGRR